MKAELTTEQTVFLARAQARLNEHLSTVALEQQSIQGFINAHPFVAEHNAKLLIAKTGEQAQREVISDYIGSIGHSGMRLEVEDGRLILTDEPQPGPQQNGR